MHRKGRLTKTSPKRIRPGGVHNAKADPPPARSRIGPRGAGDRNKGVRQMTEKQASFIRFLAQKAGFRNGMHAYGDWCGAGTESQFSSISCRIASEMIDWLKSGVTPSVED